MNIHAEPRRASGRKVVGLPQGWKPLVATVVMSLGLCLPMAAARAADANQIRADLDATRSEQVTLEARIKQHDERLETLRSNLRAERDQSYRTLHSAKRELTRQQFEIERLRQSLALVEQQIALIRTDTDRTIERYESLNPLKRSLEASGHAAKLQENAQRIGVLERDKQPLQEKLGLAEEKFAALKATQPADAEDLIPADDDPQIAALLRQRESDYQKLSSLKQRATAQKALLAAAEEQKRQAQRSRTTPSTAAVLSASASASGSVASKRRATVGAPLVLDPPAAGVSASSATWVFAISGEGKDDIESVLKLKSWVESYGAHYVQARWNGFGASTRDDTDQFRFEFAEKLRQIHPSARIILIGHGRGGGAAIEAATDVAYTLGRPIDFLGVLDPVGEGNLRANIVYNTDGCQSPEGAGSASVKGYLDCLTQAPRRSITSNVRFFYNRWQKEGRGPVDYAPLYGLEDESGETREVPSATGRFALAGNIESDQKRVFFDNDANAHRTLLEEESRLLPNLLVKYLR